VEHPHTDHQTDLREYLRVIRTRKWSIILVTLLLTGVALFFSFRQVPVYQSTTKVLVEPFSLNPAQATSTLVDLETEQGLVATQPVAERAAAALGGNRTPASLLSGLSVEVVPNTQFLLIRYSSTDPAFAAAASGAIATSYIEYRRDEQRGRIQTQLTEVTAQLGQARGKLSGVVHTIATAKNPEVKARATTKRDTLVATITLLEQQQQQLNAQLQAVEQGGGQVVNIAAVPRTPVSPNHIRTGTLAAVLGLVLGTGVAFLRERLDDSIRTRQELERRLDAPVLATVPRISGWRKREDPYLITLKDPKNPVSESYRTLRTNLQFLATKGELQTLLVTSATAGDGKTATATNLAVAMAQAGKRVVLVSADLRRPRAHRFLEASNELGLSTVLSEGTPIWHAAKNPGIENLRIVPSGPVPPNPAELLQSERMAEVIKQLRESADLIIIDTPPVLAVADASILAQHADGTLFVVDADTASRAATTQARDQLENAGARVIGAVFNKYDPSQSGAYPYYYYYYYQSTEGEDGSLSPNGEVKGRGLRKRRRKAAGAGLATGFDTRGRHSGSS
jgi:capsular exopolysaccharide synthesis family protein